MNDIKKNMKKVFLKKIPLNKNASVVINRNRNTYVFS